MGVYNFQAVPGHPSAPLAQLVVAERTATLKTSLSEVTLDYAVENGTLYLQANQNTRMAFRIVHRDTLRMTLAMIGEANYVRVHE